MIALALVLGVLAAPATPTAPVKKEAGKPAEAAPTGEAQKAKELFGAAQKLYKQARYAEAIAKFEEAYAARAHPVIYYNIGKCWEQLGETAKAMRAYKDYLRLAPDAKDKVTVTDEIANLERRLREKGLQQLMVFAEPANARIEVDGKDVGVSPVNVELIAGNHRLSVRADGFESVDRTFTMTLQRSMELTITLKPASSPAVATTTPSTPPPATPADAPVNAELKRPDMTPSPDSAPPAAGGVVEKSAKGGRKLTWVAAGVAVVGAGAGAVLGSMANGAANDLRASVHSHDEAQALYDRAQGQATGANVAYGVAGVAAVTAVVLFFVEGR